MRTPIAIPVAALLGSLAVAAAATPSPVGTETTPLDYTRTTLQQTRVIIDSDKTHNQKLAALHDLLTDFLDTDTMGRKALDKHWAKFSKSQQKEFLVLFRELFQRTYVQKLLLFDRPDFEYVGQQEKEDYVRVDTLILTPRDEFAVTYQFRPNNQGWRAYDIQIEDLSLTTNFRRQLDQLLTKSSVENVLARMRRKYGDRGDDTE